MAKEVIQAFEIGAQSSSNDVRFLIIGVIFALLFTVMAYISLKAFDEVKKGQLKLDKFFALIVRLIILMLIIGYFLLP